MTIHYKLNTTSHCSVWPQQDCSFIAHRNHLSHNDDTVQSNIVISCDTFQLKFQVSLTDQLYSHGSTSPPETLEWYQLHRATQCTCLLSHTQPVSVQHTPSPLLDNIPVMMIVWRLRGNIIRTAVCWIVWHNVHSLQHTYMSSSYRFNRLGLSHWDPYTVRRGGCLELYDCNMVEWFWSDSSLISATNWFPSVLWHCWFGHLACKNRPRNDLLCVEWDNKPLHYYYADQMQFTTHQAIHKQTQRVRQYRSFCVGLQFD